MDPAETECDRLWRLAVQLRDRGACRRCRRAGGEAAHVFSRGVRAVRWLLENGLWLCPPCHRWGHDHPAAFHAWARWLFGAKAYDRLRATFDRAGAKVDVEAALRRLRRAVRRYMTR